MKKIGIAGLLMMLVASSVAISLAWSEENNGKEERALAGAKISLSQAIENALLAVPGKAVSAELDDDPVLPVFVVEVVNQGKTYEVTLDTQSGKVIDKTLDSEDDDDHDKKDDKD